MALGLSPEAHKKRAKLARNAVFKHMRATRKSLDKGACSQAIKNLVLTAATHGMASAEFEAATNAPRTPITRAQVEKLQREVLRRCACARRKK